MPSILKTKVEKAEMLLSCSESHLSTYRTQINVSESVGDGMAYLIGKDIMIEKRVVWSIIERLLAGLALSLNVGKNIEPHQLDGLAKKIYSKYYYLSFDELMYVFDCGTSGKYGKLYDRVDEEVIFSWLEKYDTDERLSIAEFSNKKEIESQIEEKEQDRAMLAKLLEPISRVLEEEKQKEENFKAFREKYFNKNNSVPPLEGDKK